ncbi:hypothetical protein [Actinokineospora enzanensis]|uniref:hypothetical protein n=1 Tax=Actinokineospora enzanensis TaxID=155975 RepID=UPI00036013F1|nr:hypothetical protein [Actinokineospora enzanensis]
MVDGHDQLAALVAPLSLAHLTSVLARWLWDGHRAAAELQALRRDDARGHWDNAFSYGTDRYQYLVRTADSLIDEIDGLAPDRGYQSLLLKLPRVALYPLSAASGPHGPMGTASELRRELLNDAESPELALLSRREMWVANRELVLLPWSGSEDVGLTGLWAGKGEADRHDRAHVDWEWLVQLDLTGGTGQAGLFDAVPLDRPLRRRTGQRRAL